jgi:mono/diheme cytochrome c family protein
MRNLTYIIIPSLIILLNSCIKDPKKPGREYMPDMVHSTAYEAGTPNPIFKDGKTNQLPPKGSVALGKYIYPYQNTLEDYEASAANTNPFTFANEEVAGEGKRLFTVYCAVCHGDKGDGQGHLAQIGKFPPPPTYLSGVLLTLPEGKRYHTLVYGKNMMGSYASQLNHRERWLVLAYVKTLQASAAPAVAETAAADAPK